MTYFDSKKYNYPIDIYAKPEENFSQAFMVRTSFAR